MFYDCFDYNNKENIIREEYNLIAKAVEGIVDLSYVALKNGDMKSAQRTESLEQVVDELKESLRTKHILRLQKGECSVEAGFVWSDLLTNVERRNLSGTDDGFFSEIFAGMTTDYERSDTLLAG